MTIKTPEEIAAEVFKASNWFQVEDRHEFVDAMIAAIEADRAQRNTRLDRIRSVLDAEIGWETPAMLKDRIEWALGDDDTEPTPDPEAEDYGKYLDQQFWGDH